MDEFVCDWCLTDAGHCPGHKDCPKVQAFIKSEDPRIEDDMEPQTIGFHLLDPDEN